MISPQDDLEPQIDSLSLLARTEQRENERGTSTYTLLVMMVILSCICGVVIFGARTSPTHAPISEFSISSH